MRACKILSSFQVRLLSSPLPTSRFCRILNCFFFYAELFKITINKISRHLNRKSWQAKQFWRLFEVKIQWTLRIGEHHRGVYQRLCNYLKQVTH